MANQIPGLMARAREMLKEKRFHEVLEVCGEVLKQGNEENSNYESERKDCRYFCCPTEFYNYLVLRKTLGMDEKSVLWVWDDHAEAYFLSGVASIELGQIDQAYDFLKMAVELNPASLPALGELGYCFQLKRQLDGAMKAFSAIVRICRQLERFPEIVARINELTHQREELLQKGKSDEADEILRQLRRAYEASKELTLEYEARGLRGMAYCLTEFGLWQEAEDAAKQSILLEPNNKTGQGELEYIMRMREMLGTDAAGVVGGKESGPSKNRGRKNATSDN